MEIPGETVSLYWKEFLVASQQDGGDLRSGDKIFPR